MYSQLSGSYPLHIASAGGHAAAVKTLLQWGASAEVMDVSYM